jgi:hypothetical protein
VSGFDDVETELRRVVDRLNSMPIARAESVATQCHAVALRIVDRTREISDEIPADAVLPVLGVSGLGSQLAVIGGDFLAAARQRPDTDVSAVLVDLVALRRALP